MLTYGNRRQPRKRGDWDLAQDSCARVDQGLEQRRLAREARCGICGKDECAVFVGTLLAMVQTPVTSHTNLGSFHLGPVSSPVKEERRIIKDVNEVATHTHAPHT